MQYINLLNNSLEIFPIFWKNNIKNPVFLSMDDDSNWMKSLTDEQINNQEFFNEQINIFHKNNNSDLIISWYLEKRERMFTALWFKQMVEQKRFFHLGMDLSISKWTPIYAPLNWEVYDSWYEEGDWNYWWYVVLKHNVWGFVFYSLYGHQDKNNLPKIWTKLKAWEKFSILWDFSDNWWYFHHLHLQLFTQEWIDNWFISKWYIREDEIKNINKYILDPSYLFRF